MEFRIGRRAPAGLVASIGLALLVACAAEERAVSPDLAGHRHGDIGQVLPCSEGKFGDEPEFFGTVYQNGVKSCQSYLVSLVPAPDAQSHLHLPSYFPTLTTDPGFHYHYGWWDPEQQSACSGDISGQNPVGLYLANGAAFGELHGHGGVLGPPWANNGGPKEGHCVRPGRYTFTVSGVTSFDVEYLQTTYALVNNTNTGIGEWVELIAYSPAASAHDLVVNVDAGTGGANANVNSDNTVLQLQAVNGDPTSPSTSFTDQPSPTGTAATWFRFSLGGSSWTSNINDRGKALGKIFWDTSDPNGASGYYDMDAYGITTIRVHRYPNPTTASRVVTVGADIKRPDEPPAAAPAVTRTITLTRIYPDLAPGTITPPPSANQGATASVTVQERNLNSTTFGDVEAGWTGRLYLSTNTTLDGNDPQVGSFVESRSITAGGFLTTNASITIPPGQAPGAYYVLASLDAGGVVLESNETNNAGASAGTMSVTVPQVPPTACWTAERQTTWKSTDQLFNAGCSTTGANIQYRWQADAGGSWTAYSSSPLYEFPGHTTAGSKSVTLEVKNTTTGLSATSSKPFTVQNSQVGLSGPTSITVKTSYTYTVSPASLWFERFPPATGWGTGLGPQTTYTRVWSAGCYTVDLRADASTPSYLARGRLLIQVAIGSGCGGPL